jgi:hypothetical protein
VLEYEEDDGRGEMAWERSNDSPPGYTLALTIYTFSSTRGEEKEKKRRRKDTYMILQVSTNINHTPFQYKQHPPPLPNPFPMFPKHLILGPYG